jgi:hypothetical protein
MSLELLTGLVGTGFLYDAYRDIGNLGGDTATRADELAQQQMGQTQFQPYTVTTGTGGQFMAGPEGSTMSFSPEEQAMRDRLMGGAAGFYDQATQGTAGRTEDIYGRMLTAMQPGMERQRLANEERMAAQGRLGISSNMYGGMAPEDFQLNVAQQEAMNNAYLGAMQQARQEQAQQAALGQQYFGASYLPQQQLIAGLAPGQTAAAQQQQAQLYGAGLFGEASMGGINALLASGLGQANLAGNIGAGLLAGALSSVPNLDVDFGNIFG